MLNKIINFQKSTSFIAGIILLLILCVLIFGAPIVSPLDPVEQNAEDRLQEPSLTHPLGTDRFGRDIMTRTLYGGQNTLMSSVVALSVALLVGLFVGLLAGLFHGRFLDVILMRMIDVLLAFPFMVLAMVIAALFGTSLFHLLIVVAAVWWVPFARLARSIALQVKSETSFAAAKILGASNATLVLKELLPKAAGPVLVFATFELGTLILSISALSFLGLGSQPPSPEWGSMLADGRDHFMQSPHVLLGPSLFVALTVLAFNLIGEGLRDQLDPYEKL